MPSWKYLPTSIPDKVDFVQVVKLKANAKTNVSGNVEFQTCNDEKCLPPKTVNFSIALK